MLLTERVTATHPAAALDLEAFAEEPDLDSYGERVLDGAFECFSLFGVGKTTMEDIARQAGVSRPTVYRRFANRDTIVAALLQRDVRRLIAQLEELDSGDPVETIVEGFQAVIKFARVHPLLQRMLLVGDEAFLRAVTVDAGWLSLANAYLVDRALEVTPRLGRRRQELEEAAEAINRLTLSLLLTPPASFDITDDAAVGRFARRCLAPMVTAVLTTEERK